MSSQSKASEAPERDEIADEFKWDLSHIYASLDEWRDKRRSLEEKFQGLTDFSGTLGDSSSRLLGALDYFFGLEKELMLISSYANMLSDQDIRQSGPFAMKQEMTQMMTTLASAASFIEPEIIRIPEEKLAAFLREEEGLAIYRQYLDDIARRRDHTLDGNGEKLIAEAGIMSDSCEEVHSVLTNADLPYRTVRFGDGTEARIDPTSYTLHRTRPDRNDRIEVFNAFFGALKSFEKTFGAELYGEIKKNLFYRNARKYGSCLESALFADNIPVEVYRNLIENIHANLPALHDYLKLRKKLLRLDELCYYDLYPSMVAEVDMAIDYNGGKEEILRALEPLGKEYLAVIREAFGNRWIDVYPNKGKRSGAYMRGDAYDVHPYILTNFNGRYDDVSTLAHELGHAVHSSFSNKSQPFVNSHYPIFLAEVASTVNEALLVNYKLGRVDGKEKISLLGGYLEGFRTTLFRQAQFAEFELLIHEAAERGEALTGEMYTGIYLDLLRKFYGHQQGVCSIDDLYGIEWAYIPHFFMNFYVFQYSTSFIASQAIAARILSREGEVVGKYLDFLRSGSSDYPIPTLKRLGIDMLGKEPFGLAIGRMKEVMRMIEELT